MMIWLLDQGLFELEKMVLAADKKECKISLRILKLKK